MEQQPHSFQALPLQTTLLLNLHDLLSAPITLKKEFKFLTWPPNFTFIWPHAAASLLPLCLLDILCYQAHLVSGYTVPSPWDVLFPYLSLQELSKLSIGPPPRSLSRAIQALASPASTLYQTAFCLLLAHPASGLLCPLVPVRNLCFHSIPCSPIQVLPLLSPVLVTEDKDVAVGSLPSRRAHVLRKADPPQKPPTPTGQTRKKQLTPSRAQMEDRRPPGERGIQEGPQRTG